MQRLVLVGSTMPAMGAEREQGKRCIRRVGFTLIEALTVIALLAVLLAMALPRYGALRDRLAVDGAASAVVRALFDARAAAQRLGTRAAVAIDTSVVAITVHIRSDTLVRLPLQALFGVGMTTTRDSIAYAATGLGFGASNARMIVRRGAAAETISVSRTGRVRR